MKNIFLLIMAFALLNTSSYSEPNPETGDMPAPDKIKARMIFPITPNFILGGSINDIKKTLNPEPAGFDSGYFGAELDIYFPNNFGIAGGWDFYGIFNANKDGYSSLKIADTSKIFAGLLYKIILYEKYATSAQNDEFDLKLSGGVNYNFFALAEDYKSLFPGAVFYKNPASGLGFYAGAGFEYKLYTLIFGIGGYINYSYFKFPEATKGLDMWSVGVPFYMGFAF